MAIKNIFGNGKLLLSGEYFVLDGALALALPTKYGQYLTVTPRVAPVNELHWISYDYKGNVWFEAKFHLDTLEPIDKEVPRKVVLLQKILKEVRVFSSNFLKDEPSLKVETKLNFPRLWGLGSSSTLIYSIAKWAGVNAFDLLYKTMGGSGYDIACADAKSPILYTKKEHTQERQLITFNPPFSNQLYFVYLDQKQSSADAIKYYKEQNKDNTLVIEKINSITKKMVKSTTLESFESLLKEHESIVSEELNLPTVKSRLFSDYWGEAKSLGAWGGDFVMITSHKSQEETEKYFKQKGLEVIIPFGEMVI